MSKPKLSCTLFFVVGLLYVALGFYFRTGKIMAASRNPVAVWQPTIKIREIRRFPFWAFPFAMLDDNPQYRFEYSTFDSPYIWSCQSFTGKSYTANTAQIEWSADGTAIVYLDHMPRFICQQGMWTETRH